MVLRKLSSQQMHWDRQFYILDAECYWDAGLLVCFAEKNL